MTWALPSAPAALRRGGGADAAGGRDVDDPGRSADAAREDDDDDDDGDRDGPPAGAAADESADVGSRRVGPPPLVLARAVGVSGVSFDAAVVAAAADDRGGPDAATSAVLGRLVAWGRPVVLASPDAPEGGGDPLAAARAALDAAAAAPWARDGPLSLGLPALVGSRTTSGR